MFDIGLLADVKIHAFLGGVRVSATGGVRPFAEVLLGYVRYDVSILGGSGSLGGFMVAPGGGVDVPFASSAAFRVQANYRYADVNGPNHEFRLAVSLVKMW
jgi:hypothetical protein